MNALAAETSPYLRQHANNPVDWLPWGEAAFEAARARQVPLFVSIGYSACHWCHVMERESFENEEIAAIINRHFVPVKVDREERPDVDAIYMAAVQAMTQQGGWPLTVFLTPDGEPFYGGTYYPPFDHFGRPGLARVLASVSEAWTARREQVMDSARDVADYLRGRFELEGQAEPGSGLGEKAVASLAQSFDAELGGFGGAPKFPNAPLLDFLLARAYRGDGRALEMAVRTLEAMAAGGMRDHLAGGFFRYSTDATWTVPHFEKMLYDNAQLALTYLRAGQLTGRDDLTGVAADTLRFLLSDLSGPSGEFHASLDADAAGREGATYLWTPAEVAGALGNEDEARRVSAALAVTASGDLDGGSVPRPKPPTVRRAGEVAPGVLDRLLAAREKRPQPARDGKVLTSWNSLAVSALARCGAATGDEALLDAAGRALAFLRERHWRDGRLLHHSTGGVDGTAGFLDDYALFGEALLDWHAVCFEKAALDQAGRVAAELLERFRAPAGFYDVDAGETRRLITRPGSYQDAAAPAPNAAAARFLARLAAVTGRDEWREFAVETLGVMRDLPGRHPEAFGTLLQVAEMLETPPTEVVLSGDLDGPDGRALAGEVVRRYLPFTAVTGLRAGEAASTPLQEGRETPAGQAR
ncbi:MAG TPA: thioredoxin domain-containing protein, partial [Deinococcales bacterium]|nr:thioredoxin domain-containing protein [Deinococcales bacterium]